MRKFKFYYLFNLQNKTKVVLVLQVSILYLKVS